MSSQVTCMPGCGRSGRSGYGSIRVSRLGLPLFCSQPLSIPLCRTNKFRGVSYCIIILCSFDQIGVKRDKEANLVCPSCAYRHKEPSYEYLTNSSAEKQYSFEHINQSAVHHASQKHLHFVIDTGALPRYIYIGADRYFLITNSTGGTPS